MLYQDIYTKKHWLFNCRAEEQAVTPRWTRARNVPQGPTSRQHGLDVHRDQTDNSDFARRYSRRGYIRFYDPARRNAPEKPTTRCFYILFFLERSLRDVILCLAHLNARETDGDLLALATIFLALIGSASSLLSCTSSRTESFRAFHWPASELRRI